MEKGPQNPKTKEKQASCPYRLSSDMIKKKKKKKKGQMGLTPLKLKVEDCPWLIKCTTQGHPDDVGLDNMIQIWTP